MGHLSTQEANTITMHAIYLSGLAADRALTREWEHHPTHGINVAHDEKALEYQKEWKKFTDFLQTL